MIDTEVVQAGGVDKYEVGELTDRDAAQPPGPPQAGPGGGGHDQGLLDGEGVVGARDVALLHERGADHLERSGHRGRGVVAAQDDGHARGE